MSDWGTLEGRSLSDALGRYLQPLVVDDDDRERLRVVVEQAISARSASGVVEVSFPGGFVLRCRNVEDEPVDWPERHRGTARLASSFARPGQQGLTLGVDVLDLDDYDLEPPFDECPTELPIAVSDFSDWWVYLPQPDGTVALTSFDHGGNVGASTPWSPGGLFLSRVAELLGEERSEVVGDVSEFSAGRVTLRAQVSDRFADTVSKHIKAVVDVGDRSYLVGRESLVVTNVAQPTEVVGQLDYPEKLSRQDMSAGCAGEQLFVTHHDGAFRVDVSALESPGIANWYWVKGDGRDYSIPVGDVELVHYYLSRASGRGEAWYVRDGDAHRQFAEEDSKVTSAVLVGSHVLAASQDSLSRFDVSNPRAPKREARVALNAYSPQLVALPMLGHLVVLDQDPGLRVLGLATLRAPSPAWNLFPKGEKVLAWQLEDARLHLVVWEEGDRFSVATVELDADAPPRLTRRIRLDLPDGRRPWEPCKLRVEPDGFGLLFRDGEWIHWALR